MENNKKALVYHRSLKPIEAFEVTSDVTCLETCKNFKKPCTEVKPEKT